MHSTDHTRPEPRQPDKMQAVRRVEELRMTPFSEAAPVRDELMGEQTILTYSEAVGVWGLEFFENGWEFPDRWIGGSHWIDITSMWPGVTAQVTEFSDASHPTSEPLPDAVATIKAEVECQEELAKIYRQAQLTAEEKLCREQANALGWRKRAEYLEGYLKALSAMPASSGEVGQIEVLFEVWQNDDLVASSADESDARHYLAVYGQHGAATLVRAETVRTTLTHRGTDGSAEG